MTNSPLDDMQIIKTIDPEQLDGRKVLMAICEINGCFGNIDKTGRLTYKFLGTSGLFPSEMTKAETLSYYKQSETHFEDYVVNPIDKVQNLPNGLQLSIFRNAQATNNKLNKTLQRARIIPRSFLEHY